MFRKGMIKVRKNLAVVLSAAMILSNFSLPVYAAEDADTFAQYSVGDETEGVAESLEVEGDEAGAFEAEGGKAEATGSYSQAGEEAEDPTAAEAKDDGSLFEEVADTATEEISTSEEDVLSEDDADAVEEKTDAATAESLDNVEEADTDGDGDEKNLFFDDLFGVTNIMYEMTVDSFFTIKASQNAYFTLQDTNENIKFGAGTKSKNVTRYAQSYGGPDIEFTADKDSLVVFVASSEADNTQITLEDEDNNKSVDVVGKLTGSVGKDNYCFFRVYEGKKYTLTGNYSNLYGISVIPFENIKSWDFGTLPSNDVSNDVFWEKDLLFDSTYNADAKLQCNPSPILEDGDATFINDAKIYVPVYEASTITVVARTPGYNESFTVNGAVLPNPEPGEVPTGTFPLTDTGSDRPGFAVIKSVGIETHIKSISINTLYTVSFNVAGADPFYVDPGSTIPGDKVIEATEYAMAAVPEGTTFSHWSVSENGADAFDFSTEINKNTILYPVYDKIKLTVSFDGVAQEVEYGNDAIVPPALMIEGKVFAGWAASEADQAALRIVPDSAFKEIKESASYYSVYTDESKDYVTISFNYAGRTVSVNIVERGADLKAPGSIAAIPETDDLIGWGIETAADTVAVKPGEAINTRMDGVYYAVTEKKVYKVSAVARFEKLEGGYEEETVSVSNAYLGYNDSIYDSRFDVPSRKGFRLASIMIGGCRLDQGMRIQEYVVEDVPGKRDIEIVLTYERNRYTVNSYFKAGDADTGDNVQDYYVSDNEVKYGTGILDAIENMIKAAGKDYRKTLGYKFVNWLIKEEAVGEEDVVMGDLTASANYISANIIRVSFTYMTDFDKVETNTVSVTEGDLFENWKPEILTRFVNTAGDSITDFTGWKLGNRDVNDSFILTADAKFVAGYQTRHRVNVFGVRETLSGNDIVDTMPQDVVWIVSGNSVSADDIFIGDYSTYGYKEPKLYTDPEHTAEYTGAPVDAPLVLYAYCGLRDYSIGFYDDDNKLISSAVVKHGATVSAPSAPELEGYEFVGWYSQVGDEFDETAPVTASALYYAEYVEKKYDLELVSADNISYRLNDVDVKAGRSSVEYDSSVIVAAVSRFGYSVDELSAKAVKESVSLSITELMSGTFSGNIRSISFNMPASGVKVSATAKAIEYTVSVNGGSADREKVTIEDEVKITPDSVSGQEVSKVTVSFGRTSKEINADDAGEYRFAVRDVINDTETTRRINVNVSFKDSKPDGPDGPDQPEQTVSYNVTVTADHVTVTDVEGKALPETVSADSALSFKAEAEEGYEKVVVKVTISGNDAACEEKDGVYTIDKVTGDVVISASATKKEDKPAPEGPAFIVDRDIAGAFNPLTEKIYYNPDKDIVLIPREGKSRSEDRKNKETGAFKAFPDGSEFEFCVNSQGKVNEEIASSRCYFAFSAKKDAEVTVWFEKGGDGARPVGILSSKGKDVGITPENYNEETGLGIGVFKIPADGTYVLGTVDGGGNRFYKVAVSATDGEVNLSDIDLDGGQGGDDKDKLYPINCDNKDVRFIDKDGKDITEAKKDDTIKVVPVDGKKIDSIEITAEDGSKVKINDNGDGTYSFVMPEGGIKSIIVETSDKNEGGDNPGGKDEPDPGPVNPGGNSVSDDTVSDDTAKKKDDAAAKSDDLAGKMAGKNDGTVTGVIQALEDTVITDLVLKRGKINEVRLNEASLRDGDNFLTLNTKIKLNTGSLVFTVSNNGYDAKTFKKMSKFCKSNKKGNFVNLKPVKAAKGASYELILVSGKKILYIDVVDVSLNKRSLKNVILTTTVSENDLLKGVVSEAEVKDSGMQDKNGVITIATVPAVKTGIKARSDRSARFVSGIWTVGKQTITSHKPQTITVKKSQVTVKVNDDGTLSIAKAGGTKGSIAIEYILNGKTYKAKVKLQ